jgi:integrase
MDANRENANQGPFSGRASGRLRVLIRSKGPGQPFHLYYVDPATGKERTKRTAAMTRDDAQRAAGVWEQELVAYRGERDDGWKLFRDKFRDEHVASLSDKTRAGYGTALNHYERLMNPHTLADLTPAALSQFQAKLVAEKRPVTSIGNYLTHMRTALNFAAMIGMIDKAPRIKMPKQNRRSFMRGRPVTAAEYRRMLQAAPPDLRRLMELLWLSGLRLSEGLKISWDSPPIVAKLDAKPYPLLMYFAEGHKARRDDAVPMTPDLAAWLRRTPAKARVGFVAPVSLETQPRVSEAISEIGRAAGVVVSDDGKAASAHDLRRAFGTRWAHKVMPAVLRVLMRHGDIQTTLKYYVGITATDAGDALWK